MPIITIKIHLAEHSEFISSGDNNDEIKRRYFHTRKINLHEIQIEYAKCDKMNCDCSQSDSAMQPILCMDLDLIKQKLDSNEHILCIIPDIKIITSKYETIFQIKNVIENVSSDLEKINKIKEILCESSSHKSKLESDCAIPLTKCIPYNAKFIETSRNIFEAKMHVSDDLIGKNIYVTIMEEDDGSRHCGKYNSIKEFHLPTELTLTCPLEKSELCAPHTYYLVFHRERGENFKFDRIERYY